MGYDCPQAHSKHVSIRVCQGEVGLLSPSSLGQAHSERPFNKTEFELGWLVILMLYACPFSTESCPSYPTTQTPLLTVAPPLGVPQKSSRSTRQTRHTCCFTARRNRKIDIWKSLLSLRLLLCIGGPGTSSMSNYQIFFLQSSCGITAILTTFCN